MGITDDCFICGPHIDKLEMLFARLLPEPLRNEFLIYVLQYDERLQG